jgi:hypothetical protein
VTRRRVVVGLGPGIVPRDLEAAARVAGRIGAELIGLFVEDVELLRFAALPFAEEIGAASAARRRLDAEALERALRVRAAEAERALAAAAASVAVPWSFRVVRGFAAAELLAAASEALEEASREALRLLLLGDERSPAARWAEEACARLTAAEAAALRAELVHAADLEELAAALRAGTSGVLVLPAEEGPLSAEELLELLEQSAAPVLLLPARRR